jgi:hypothetical protein
MKTVLAILLTAATMRADYSYQSTTQMTGGSLYNMMKALGPLARGARDPIVTTNLIKGNRMATIAKDRTTIIDLDKETITEIDTAKKQYSVMTFAQMKQAMEEAVAKAQQQKAKAKPAGSPNTEASFKVSAKATGQTKTVGVLNAKEMVLTMTMEATNKDNGQGGSMDITVDSWLAAVPGYEEVKEFQRKMGEKMGYAFGSGMSQIAMTQPQTLQGFAEVAKEMNKVEGVPVQSIMKMGTVGSGDAASGQQTSQQQQTQQNNGGITGAALSRLGGFGRKKNDQSKDQPAPAADQPQSGSGSLLETTTELSSFSSGPVDAAKFEVPAGFKKVDAALPRGAR